MMLWKKKFFIVLFYSPLLLASHPGDPTHLSSISCTSYPGNQLCWQLTHLITDFEKCSPEARYLNRMQKFTIDAMVLPGSIPLEPELKKLVQVMDDIYHKAYHCIKGGSSNFEGLAGELKIKMDFQETLKLLLQ